MKFHKKQFLTSRLRYLISGFQRFWTNSFQASRGFDLMRTGIAEALTVFDTAFLRRRPATVGREAPRMARGSEGPACEFADSRVDCCA